MKIILTIIIVLLVFTYYKSSITAESKEFIDHKEKNSFLFKRTHKN